ncbi:MAG: Bro-N domain-containing protein [Leptolinea sp.]
MTKETAIKLFETKQVRSVWDSEVEKWYFSIIDVIEALTGTDRPRKYWSDLKAKLKKEGSELSEKIGQLKMAAEDGKMRITDVADSEQLFRLIQSVPSPKAEPFKMWLAKVGSERIDEIEDPEKGQEFAILTDEITQAWSGFSTKQYKQYKQLKKENLRDHMSNLELVLNMLAEATTTPHQSPHQLPRKSPH